MGVFVIRIVVDILGHIRVQHCKSGSISWVSASAGDFIVRNTSEFVVLHPEVRLNDLGCRCEPKQGCISPSEMTAAFVLLRLDRWALGEKSDACCCQSVLNKRTPIDCVLHAAPNVFHREASCPRSLNPSIEVNVSEKSEFCHF